MPRTQTRKKINKTRRNDNYRVKQMEDQSSLVCQSVESSLSSKIQSANSFPRPLLDSQSCKVMMCTMATLDMLVMHIREVNFF
jgi:hypothetical protein